MSSAFHTMCSMNYRQGHSSKQTEQASKCSDWQRHHDWRTGEAGQPLTHFAEMFYQSAKSSVSKFQSALEPLVVKSFSDVGEPFDGMYRAEGEGRNPSPVDERLKAAVQEVLPGLKKRLNQWKGGKLEKTVGTMKRCREVLDFRT